MWQHLKSWRLHRGLTQVAVADALGKRHTTIGRWESGKMKLTTTDLAALANVYRASVSQLQAPPAAAALISRLDKAQQILSGLSDDDMDAWLAVGTAMLRK